MKFRAVNVLTVLFIALVAIVPMHGFAATQQTTSDSFTDTKPQGLPITSAQFLIEGDAAYVLTENGVVVPTTARSANELLAVSAAQTLRSTWTDSTGTAHEIITPVGTGGGDLARAISAHDALLEAAQKKWPPVKPTPVGMGTPSQPLLASIWRSFC